MNIQIWCDVCNATLEQVREWTDRGDVIITVKPCEECAKDE